MNYISRLEQIGDFTGAIAAVGGLEARVLWCDAEANLWALDSQDKVIELIKRCCEVNVNVIVVDVKPAAGVVLYDSSIAPRLRSWSGRDYPKDYDLLRTMVEEGHRAGLEVYASVNVFSEAVAGHDTKGAALTHPQWQCVRYDIERYASSRTSGIVQTIEGRPKFIRTDEAPDIHSAIFVNPADPDVQAYELSIISETITNYDVDGIVLDRTRYPDIYTDFSDQSKSSFEKWLGEKIESFPEDIFVINPLSEKNLIRGRHFGRWMEWRATQIHDFIAAARQTVKKLKPEALIGAYVGSWYDTYYDVGANWASPRHNPPYDFASPTYKHTGFADQLDWICTGCYYYHAAREQAEAAGAPGSASVQAGAEQSVTVVQNDTFVYGSLYLRLYARDPAAFEQAISMSQSKTQGVMLFDLFYLRDYDWWNILKRAFAGPAKTPHSIPGLLDKIKEMRQFIIEDSNK